MIHPIWANHLFTSTAVKHTLLITTNEERPMRAMTSHGKVGVAIVALILAGGLTVPGTAVAAGAPASHGPSAPVLGGYWLYTFYSDASHTTVVGQRGCMVDDDWGTTSPYYTRYFVYSDC